MNFLTRFFHELVNPHCDHCDHDRECKSCETLRQLLESEKFEKKQLIDHLLYKPERAVERSETPEPLMSKAIPWRVRQQQLEEDDRKKVEVLRKRDAEIKNYRPAPIQESGSLLQNQSVEELEQELGVQDVQTGN